MKFSLNSFIPSLSKMWAPFFSFHANELIAHFNSQRFYKKAAAFVLRAVAKHSPDLAQAVVDSNALETLVPCLEEFDPTVKEAAAWAIGYIATHTPGIIRHYFIENFIVLKRVYFNVRACAACS